MKVNQYYTTGMNDIHRQEYEVPPIEFNEISVKSVYTGVCSSDVAMYMGEFPLLPTNMHGNFRLVLQSKENGFCSVHLHSIEICRHSIGVI